MQAPGICHLHGTRERRLPALLTYLRVSGQTRLVENTLGWVVREMDLPYRYLIARKIKIAITTQMTIFRIITALFVVVASATAVPPPAAALA